MARNNNTTETQRGEFVENMDHDLEQREMLLRAQVKQHQVDIAVIEDEIARIQAARKALIK